jgi:hypothetical protein
MIERILSLKSLAPEAAQAAERVVAGGGKSFSDALAQETSRVSQRAAIDAPRGETWKPVAGHRNYVEITDGPRKGQYLNVGDGPRRGLTFTIDKVDGKQYKVYGSGEAAERVEIKDRPEGASIRRGGIPRNEVWEPVEGHNFRADILNGPRNGWFVNISGGVRHGQAFHIVERNGKTFHVYGTGDDKLWVEIRKRPEPSDAIDTSTDVTDATDGATADPPAETGSTGGTAAPDAGDPTAR